jgi:hypothetical protein
MREHIIITGTGRAGTSFLMQLLSHLMLDTGFQPDDLPLDEVAHAGLEVRLGPTAPYIIKTPWYCDHMDEALADKSVSIKHVIIPVRQFEAAAESRIRVQKERTGREDKSEGSAVVPGGLWRTQLASEQANVCRQKFVGLMEVLVRHDVPFTCLWYPRLAQDPTYLHRKLACVLPLPGIEMFEAAFLRVVRPDWISRFGEDDR